MHTSLRAAFATAVVGLALAAPAHAVPATYTFSGMASGILFDATGAPSDFTDQLFTIVLSADTADITGDTPDDGFYRIANFGGSFSEGAFNDTLSPFVTVVVNANASGTPPYEDVNFFNATFDNGLGFDLVSALAGYNLSTSIGPLTVPSAPYPGANLTPTFAGGTFALESGGAVEFTGNTSLTFTADVAGAVPEPAPVMLLAAGFAALALARRMARVARTTTAPTAG